MHTCGAGRGNEFSKWGSMKYKAVIFDLGDTLLFSSPSQGQIYADRLRYLGHSIGDENFILVQNAITNAANEQIAKEKRGAPRMPDDEFERMLDCAVLRSIGCQKNIEQSLERLRQLPLPQQELMIVDGAERVLQSLFSRGYRLGVVSNHKKWMIDYLKKVKLADYFETIIISEIVGVEKPDVRIMQIAIDSMSLSASDCLYVGDHPFDVLCAKEAGLDCVWLSPPEAVLSEDIPYKEDYRIQCLEGLLEWL